MDRKRVLIVDDDLDRLELIKGLLEVVEDEVQIQSAVGAEAALEHMDKMAVEGVRYDMLIAEYSMGGRDGLWLLNQVRDKHPACERTLVSNFEYVELHVALEPGVVQHYFARSYLDGIADLLVDG